MGVLDIRRKERVSLPRYLIQLRQQIPDMEDGDAVAVDGDRISPNHKIDRRELLDESDVSVLLSTDIAQGFIVKKNRHTQRCLFSSFFSNGLHPLWHGFTA